tara:strand:+ start:4050 stop:4220 length:171 start_codon:yes stop_codon:yes gene_type:complete
MSRPVVIAANGIGLPVIAVDKNAPPATVADNGYGEPIVLVEANGQPMVISNLPEPA